MIGIFSRHRSLALLASVVLAQTLLLAFQIKRNRDVRLIRVWAVEMMTPIERLGTWTTSSTKGAWFGYVDLHNARSENERLRTELGALQIRNKELESESLENKRLANLWTFREGHPEVQMVAAEVIGASADPSSHTLFVNRGTRDHLRNNLAVVTPDGIVGKIVEVFPSTAQVLLINDKESGVGALFADSRTHGVVKGSGDPEPHMDYVVNDEKISPGETVLTSGEDRIFPKGLLIGAVMDAKAAQPFQVIRVRPAARLDRLEDVIVLLTQQEFTPKAGDNGDGSESFSLVPPPPPAPIPSGPESAGQSPASSAAAQKTAPAAANVAGTASPKPAAAGVSPKPSAAASTQSATAKPSLTTTVKSAQSTTAKPSAPRE
jgi:rod shape-determining protein MreC